MNKPALVLDNSEIFKGLIAAEREIYDRLTDLVGDDAKEAVKTIRQHAIISASCGVAVVVPGLDLVGFVANNWTMYARINNALGISLSENALKSIASAVVTNIVSIIPGFAVGAVFGSLLKVVPVFGTGGGMLVAGTTYYVLTTVMGWIYLKAITTLVSSNKAINEENLKAATKQVSKDKKFVRSVYEAAKSEHEKEEPNTSCETPQSELS
jgi:uncharacterized protein (DUF697 family)